MRLKVIDPVDCSYGVVTLRDFIKGEYLLKYPGEMIAAKEGKRRDKIYGEQGKGCYLFYFIHNGQHLCIDGTHSHQLGRFVNDSENGNCVMKKVVIDGVPHLALFASENLKKGVELRYDYGDSESLWWRHQNSSCLNVSNISK
ncbi:N-lysine methyltransferase KMT5A-like [Hydractinia symbiolongicarpus]|uniref:N-lysine methyltransferase KMT5A-like n=1 Tax=Hydractinia symbiolongicarpus TaxID=13093 RepID=UPI00254F7A5D|nr:N-lysine methyltransferase KMT5A-like [Hydractinia symbiolongicarpus]